MQRYDNRILGENLMVSTDCSQTGLNNNILVCGCSGCGKTVSIAEPFLFETHQASLIATVTKRRLVKKYTPIFQERGYTVEDLNFVQPAKSTISYDPMNYIKSYADITFLARAIVNANPRKEQSFADPYWDEAATSLLSAEIAYTMMTNDHPSFTDVLDLQASLVCKEVRGNLVTTLDDKFTQIEKADPKCFAVNCWNSFKQLPMSTAGCVYSSLNTTIDTIFTPELRKMFALENKVNFQKIATEKTVLFISTSPVNPSLNSFVNMFYAQVFKRLFEYAESLPEGVLPIPVHMLCDDFATGSKVLNFAEYISIFREKGIAVTLMVQSESQLARMYGQEDATTIINNCDTYVYMGGMDLKTCCSVSERLNVPLDEVLYMPIGKECVFRRGQRPIMTTRYDTFKDERYQQVSQMAR